VENRTFEEELVAIAVEELGAFDGDSRNSIDRRQSRQQAGNDGGTHGSRSIWRLRGGRGVVWRATKRWDRP
jgi:hypothetical protein